MILNYRRFLTHYAKTELFGEGSDVAKGERKKKRITSSKMLEDLKDLARDRPPWLKAIYVVPKNQPQ